MSDQDEVPDLSTEAKKFLERHERTGEPPAAELERGKQRLAALTRGAAPARSLKRRSLLPPEVTAAAAVVAIVLGVQVLYLAFRAEPAIDAPAATEPAPQVTQSVDADAKELITAWRAGDLGGAKRLASKDCHSGACRALAIDVTRALGLAGRIDSLAPGELDELGALDTKLAEGKETTLGRLVAQRQRGVDSPPLPSVRKAEAELLFTEAQEENRAKNYERAALRLEKCVRIAPTYAPCHRLAGSVYAAIAARDASASDLEKARRYYQSFLEVAPADDEYVPKVQAILEAASDEPVAPEVATPAQVTIAVGHADVLTLEQNITRLAIGDPSVADISVAGPRKVRVVGVGPGKTTLLVWLTHGQRQAVLINVVRAAGKSVQDLFDQASRARKSGDWASAVAFARQVRLLEPGHVGAGPILGQAAVVAREAYLRGYQLRETDPEGAIAQFKYVMSLTSPGDETYEKAKSRIAELEHR